MNSSQPDELTDFLLSRQLSPVNKLDWGEVLTQWKDALEQLYQKITGELLAESIAKQLVTIARAEKTIKEEHLGTYKAPELVLKINEEIVRFSPKGRNIVGAKGRVDLIGELDSITLVLEPTGRWNVVISRVPWNVKELTSKTLVEALQRVMR